MKKFLFLTILFNSLWAYAQERTELNVFSFNVRYNSSSDGVNIWENRKEWVAESIKFFEGDLVGAQEVNYEQLQDLDSLLPHYDYFGVGRQGGNEGEHSPIFYRKDRFEVLAWETFWLSETPNQVASVGWDAALPRIVTWGHFREKETGKTFYHFNTHFDHRGRNARKESASLILRKIKEIAGDEPVVVTGDFNIRPEEDPYNILTKELIDTYHQSKEKYGPDHTFNGWDYKSEGEYHRIDFVFFREGGFTPEKYHVLDGQRGQRFISDHFPVIVKFRLE